MYGGVPSGVAGATGSSTRWDGFRLSSIMTTGRFVSRIVAKENSPVPHLADRVPSQSWLRTRPHCEVEACRKPLTRGSAATDLVP